jgi:pSer/pThr/pTyr-binding forkhead associated (FHA) protein
MSSDRGAPTGLWETKPGHLDDEAAKVDVAKAKALLKVSRPNLPPVEIPLEKPEFTIGRDAHRVDLVLDDELVSREHAKIRFNRYGYVQLLDLGSKNGITFHGRTVRKLNLVNGDQFEIGKAQFEFHADLQRFRDISPPAPTDIPAQTPMEDDLSLLAEDIPEPVALSEEQDD